MGSLAFYDAIARKFHHDTVNFDPEAQKLALAFAGPAQILAGSDYPHQIGSIPLMRESIARLPVTETERSAILGGNAARLLGLKEAALGRV